MNIQDYMNHIDKSLESYNDDGTPTELAFRRFIVGDLDELETQMMEEYLASNAEALGRVNVLRHELPQEEDAFVAKMKKIAAASLGETVIQLFRIPKVLTGAVLGVRGDTETVERAAEFETLTAEQALDKLESLREEVGAMTDEQWGQIVQVCKAYLFEEPQIANAQWSATQKRLRAKSVRANLGKVNQLFQSIEESRGK